MADLSGFEAVAADLRRGDFTLLAPHFGDPKHLELATAAIVTWFDAGAFADDPVLAAEALTCACWLGQAGVAAHLLDRGVSMTAGTGTGMDALHWAVNRGQLDSVGLLLARGTDIEARSTHGGTALGTAIWSAINEPKPGHLAIIETLLATGARTDDAKGATGHAGIDELLRRQAGGSD